LRVEPVTDGYGVDIQPVAWVPQCFAAGADVGIIVPAGLSKRTHVGNCLENRVPSHIVPLDAAIFLVESLLTVYDAHCSGGR
jgi:hypothetical protein